MFTCVFIYRFQWLLSVTYTGPGEKYSLVRRYRETHSRGPSCKMLPARKTNTGANREGCVAR